MLKNPKYGYGSGMNPCIDCRMMMYDEAKKHMKKIGADFLITGEVLHQRPMSQNSNALSVIEKETGMAGKNICPLSTQPFSKKKNQKKRYVDRSIFRGIQRRTKKEETLFANKICIIDP